MNIKLSTFKKCLPLLIVILLVSCLAQQKQTATSTPQKVSPSAEISKQFHSVIDDYIRDYLYTYPHIATYTGMHLYSPARGATVKLNHELPNYSEDVMAARVEKLRNFLTILESLPAETLSINDLMELRLLHKAARSEVFKISEMEIHKNSSLLHVSSLAQCIVYPMELDYAAEDKRMSDILWRMQWIPSYVDRAVRMLNAANPLEDGPAIVINRLTTNLIEKELPARIKDNNELMASYDNLKKPVLEALGKLQKHLEGPLKSKPIKEWRLGEERYSQVFENIFEDLITKEQAAALAEARIEEIKLEMFQLAKPIYCDKREFDRKTCGPTKAEIKAAQRAEERRVAAQERKKQASIARAEKKRIQAEKAEARKAALEQKKQAQAEKRAEQKRLKEEKIANQKAEAEKRRIEKEQQNMEKAEQKKQQHQETAATSHVKGTAKRSVKPRIGKKEKVKIKKSAGQSESAINAALKALEDAKKALLEAEQEAAAAKAEAAAAKAEAEAAKAEAAAAKAEVEAEKTKEPNPSAETKHKDADKGEKKRAPKGKKQGQAVNTFMIYDEFASASVGAKTTDATSKTAGAESQAKKPRSADGSKGDASQNSEQAKAANVIANAAAEASKVDEKTMNKVISFALKQIEKYGTGASKTVDRFDKQVQYTAQLAASTDMLSVSNLQRLKIARMPTYLAATGKVFDFQSAPVFVPEKGANLYVSQQTPTVSLTGLSTPWMQFEASRYGSPGLFELNTRAVTIPKQTRRAMRVLFGDSAFLDGWGLYSAIELARLENGKNQWKLKIIALAAEMLAAKELLVEIGLHCEGLTEVAAVSVLKKQTNVTGLESKNIVKKIKQSPGDAVSTFLGLMLWRDTRDEVSAALEDTFSAKQFHDNALKLGAIPVVDLAEALLKNPDELP